jgi:transposase
MRLCENILQYGKITATLIAVIFMRYKQGQSRQQTSILPPSIEDYVDENAPVRVIDAFVGSLDLIELGFHKAITASTGCKPYDPADLLKLYLYGYLNQITSTRKLEKECHRNLEVMWLMCQLAPDFKTIADFRKDNRSAIKQACQALVQFCRKLGLIQGKFVAIDGSKFKAAASKQQAMTKAQLKRYVESLNKRIDRYLEQLSHSEQDASPIAMDQQSVAKALAALQKEQAEKQEALTDLEQTGKNQVCFTEPDAQLMKSGRDGMVVGYNAQNAVDAEHQLIVAHELTPAHTDNQQLQPMTTAVEDALETKPDIIAADAGYSNGEQLETLQAQGHTIAVPANRSRNPDREKFQKQDFEFLDEENAYRCPAGERLHYTTKHTKNKMHLYSRTGCNECSLQSTCTKADKRWVSRHVHEDALNQATSSATPERMVNRMKTVEPPFGTLKRLLNKGRFTCWGLDSAASEYSLGVMSYNLMRMMNIIGIERLLAELS